MKNLLTTILFTCSTILLWGQAPQKMTYQSVIRNSSDALVTSSVVGIQISILQSSSTGVAVYIETHSPTTNANGLATIEIGSGTIVAGNFSSIDWSAGPYFLKTDTDPSGGTVYSISGTAELLSVPYALYAENSFSGDYNDLTNTPAIPTNTSDLVNDSGFITSPNDADSDPTNELQSLSQAGSTVSLSNGGGSITINDNDSDPVNEIQSLSLNGQDITISGGNTITLPSGGANTLDQAYDQGGAGAGRVITIDAGEIELINGTVNGIGLRASTTNTGVGLLATSTNAGNVFSPIQATTNATSNLTAAIVGSTSGGAYGVSGQVESTATASAGIYGNNLRTTGGYGTYGIGHSGIVGETNYQLGFGTYGRNYDAIGPTGNAVGAYGLGYIGVWGDQSDALGYSVYANGDFGAAGTKAFSIDHPLDPENKYLRHYSIESNEVLNMYRGTIEFDSNGEAIVSLPSYFDAVNANFSYHLTPIGSYAPLYIKEKIKNGQFIIAGGSVGMEVSWSVYAERNDPYLQQHPESKQVEVNKEDWNKGKYLQPDLYGQPDTKKIVKPLESKDQNKLNIIKK